MGFVNIFKHHHVAHSTSCFCCSHMWDFRHLFNKLHSFNGASPSKTNWIPFSRLFVFFRNQCGDCCIVKMLDFNFFPFYCHHFSYVCFHALKRFYLKSLMAVFVSFPAYNTAFMHVLDAFKWHLIKISSILESN